MWQSLMILSLAFHINYPVVLDEHCVMNMTGLNVTEKVPWVELDSFNPPAPQTAPSTENLPGVFPVVSTTTDAGVGITPEGLVSQPSTQRPIVVWLSHEFEEESDGDIKEQAMQKESSDNSSESEEKHNSTESKVDQQETETPESVMKAKMARREAVRKAFEALDRSPIVKTVVILLYVLQPIWVYALTAGAYGKKIDDLEMELKREKRKSTKAEKHRTKRMSHMRRR